MGRSQVDAGVDDPAAASGRQGEEGVEVHLVDLGDGIGADFIAPLNANISNCGSVTIVKEPVPTTENGTFGFSRTFLVDGETAPAPDFDVTTTIRSQVERAMSLKGIRPLFALRSSANSKNTLY